MKVVTIREVAAWEPCGYDEEDDGNNYTHQRIEALFAGRDTLSAGDIVALDIPAEDKLWALCHPEFLSDEQMHLLACDFAERVVHLCGADPQPRAAIEAKRKWLRGEVSNEELVAAWDAARAARAAAWATRDTRDTTWDAWDAAWDASAVASAVASAAAWDASAIASAAWDAGRAAAWATWAASAASAAWDAAWEWQLERTIRYIED